MRKQSKILRKVIKIMKNDFTNRKDAHETLWES